MVAYCRVSTLEQQKKGYGIDIQMRDIKRYAEVFSLPVDDFYIDEARSGISERREALDKLVRDCKTGKVSAIIVPSLDRLSRDLRMTENLLHNFQKHGVRVFIADMPHYDGSNRRDVLIRQIREAIAEENRKEIIERLKKGREERIRKGLMAGGTLPYGYARQGRKIKQNSQEVEIVRLIFQLKAQYKSGQQIANCLNDNGYRRRNNSPWTQRQVSAILNRANLYQKGMISYGETRGKNEVLIIT